MGYDYCKRNVCQLTTCKRDIKQHSKSHRSIQLKLSPMLQLLANAAKKRENDRTWVIPGHWMGKWWDWDRNFDYMSYSVCKLSKFKASEDLKWILWYFQLWKAWTATCWSAELDWIFSCFYPEFTSRYFLEIQNSCHTITCLSSF